MKIALPVNDNNINTEICISFGRTPYFLIYNTGTKEAVFIDNSAAASQGGAGIKASQMIVDNKADAVLTPRCGENAAEVLQAAHIKIYKTNGDSIRDNIDTFEAGKLPLLDEIHAGFNNHGGQ